jgi:hypothetical protein
LLRPAFPLVSSSVADRCFVFTGRFESVAGRERKPGRLLCAGESRLPEGAWIRGWSSKRARCHSSNSILGLGRCGDSVDGDAYPPALSIACRPDHASAHRGSLGLDPQASKASIVPVSPGIMGLAATWNHGWLRCNLSTSPSPQATQPSIGPRSDGDPDTPCELVPWFQAIFVTRIAQVPGSRGIMANRPC